MSASRPRPVRSETPVPSRGWVLAAAAAAGAAAMADQTVWFRCLSLPLGSDVLGSSVALAAFLAGLALGGEAGGRWSRRTDGERVFPIVQAVLAAASVAAPFAMRVLGSLMPGWEGPLDAAARSVTAVLALTVPAALMGATVPLLVGRAGAAAPRVYAANAAGALAGALGAGFFLMPAAGVLGTAAAAAFLHAAAALLPRASMTGAGAVERRDAGVQSPFGPRSAAALLGASILGAEIVWMRVLTLRFIDSTLYSFSLAVAVVMAGLALGAAVAAATGISRVFSGKGALTAGCLGISCWSLAAWAMLPQASDWMASRLPSISAGGSWRFSDVLLAAGFFSAVGLGVPALLTGWAAGCLYKLRPGDPLEAGSLTCWNNAGAAAGAVLAGLVVVPWLGIKGGVVFFAALPLAAAFAAGSRPAAVAAGLFFMVAAAGLRPIRTGLPLAGSLAHHEDSYEEGRGATVAVTRDFLADESLWNKALWIDGQVISGTEPDMQLNQKMLAHIPMLMHPAPREVLSVGLGSGGTLASLLKHDARVTVVEILPAVVAAARHFPENHQGALSDPRARIVVDDARRFLARTPRRFDVIISDVTNLHYLGNANLFTREYFAAARARLREGGVFAAWVPREPGLDDLRVILATFQSVFPRAGLWYPYGRDAHFSILVGMPDDAGAVGWGEWLARLSRPGVTEDLASVGAADPLRLPAALALSPDGLARACAGAPVHRDWRPILDYTAPRRAGGWRLEGLSFLREASADTERVFSLPLAQQAAFARAREARQLVLAGYSAAEEGRALEALDLLERGLKARPEDTDLARSLSSERVGLMLRLADAAAGLGDIAAARDLLGRVLALRPDHYSALNNLGILAEAGGRREAAVEFFQRALAANPEAVDTRRRLLALVAAGGFGGRPL